MARAEPLVVGYLYRSEADDLARDRTICRIIARAEPNDGLGIEPRFVVQFSDGQQLEVLGQQLRPWYPV